MPTSEERELWHHPMLLSKSHATLFGMFRSIFLLSILVPLVAFAEELPYTDIPFGSWFVEEVQQFVDEGYLDTSQEHFRPGDRASRAEFIKLIVELNGGILDEVPSSSSFADVSPGDWFFGYVHESAREGWTRGDGDCYGNDPCSLRPQDPVTRAEAAVLVRRAFGKRRMGMAPAFADNPAGEWYKDAIQSAADHCILRGDDGTRNVRPHDNLNRAEMVAMLSRVDEGRRYPDC